MHNASSIPLAASIHDLPPMETGGIEARQGFHFQDHVAAGFCIDMLMDKNLQQVWCETQDDITLLWSHDSGELVEFVQVKSNELDQLWSIAELCKKHRSTNGGGIGTSIVERSLAHDRCREPCRFRLVTARPTSKDLDVLRLPVGDPERSTTGNGLLTLKQEMTNRLGGFTSPNKHDAAYWVDLATWAVCHSADAIETQNKHKLRCAVEDQAEYLVSDQIDELYANLLNLVQDAALERDDRQKKKVLRDGLVQWFVKAVQNAAHPNMAGSGAKVREKLAAAYVAEDQIDTAITEKWQYRMEVLTPKYLQPIERKRMEGEIRAKLQQLRAQLDAGELADDGRQFHVACLKALEAIRQELPADTKPTSELMQGFMYALADRCLHRFRRVSA